MSPINTTSTFIPVGSAQKQTEMYLEPLLCPIYIAGLLRAHHPSPHKPNQAPKCAGLLWGSQVHLSSPMAHTSATLLQLRAGTCSTSGQTHNQQHPSLPHSLCQQLEVAEGKEWPFGKAQHPSDRVTQALLQEKNTSQLCRKHIPVPCTIDFPVKRQANPLKLATARPWIEAASLLYQRLTLYLALAAGSLLADLSFDSKHHQLQGKQGKKSHIRS